MFHTLSEIHFQSGIVKLAAYGEHMLALDGDLHLHLLDISRHYTLSGSLDVKATLLSHYPDFRYEKEKIQLSAKGDLSIINAKNHQIVFYNIEGSIQKKGLTSWHNQRICHSAFDEDGRFFCSGDVQGNIFVYETENFHVQCLPPKLEKPIVRAGFMHDGEFLYYCDESGENRIFDLYRNTLHDVIKLDAPIIVGYWCKTRDEFVFLTQSGHIGCYSLTSKSSRYMPVRTNTINTAIPLDSENRFCYVDDSGMLYLHHLDQPAECAQVELGMKGISRLFIVERFMAVGNKEGLLRVIDMEKYKNDVRVNTDVKNFRKIREFLSKNRFLYASEEINRRLESGWDQTLHEVITNLTEDNALRAHKLASPFFEDERKLGLFEQLKSHTGQIKEFYGLVRKKEVKEAYHLVQEYPFLKQTRKYADLERHWQKIFNSSKKLMLSDPQKHRKTCEKALKPFLWEKQKQDLIMALIDKTELFKRMETAVHHENFKLFFSLADKNPFLTNTSLYTRILDYGWKKYEEAVDYHQKHDTEKAHEIISSIRHFSPILKESSSFFDHVDKMILMEQYFSENNVEEANKLLKEDFRLRLSPSYLSYRSQWEDTLKNAFHAAQKGDSEKCFSLLQPYLEPPYLESKIASVLQVAYINQLLFSRLKKINVDWSASLLLYMERFGHDPYIKRFTGHFKVEKLIEPLLFKADSEGYKKLPLLNSIIIMKDSHG